MKKAAHLNLVIGAEGGSEFYPPLSALRTLLGSPFVTRLDPIGLKAISCWPRTKVSSSQLSKLQAASLGSRALVQSPPRSVRETPAAMAATGVIDVEAELSGLRTMVTDLIERVAHMNQDVQV